MAHILYKFIIFYISEVFHAIDTLCSWKVLPSVGENIGVVALYLL